VYNITGGRDLTLQEVNRVSEVVTSLADPNANIIFGAVVDDAYEGEIHVTIIATGFAQSFEDQLLNRAAGMKPQGAARGAAGGVGAAQQVPGTNPPPGPGQPPPFGRRGYLGRF
jgi:cell division protein FtsZ